MITIIFLVLLFLLYVYISMNYMKKNEVKEGLMNQYSPINVNTDLSSNIYDNVLTNRTSPLFDQKYLEMKKEDVLLDMKYFNNASNIIFAYKAKNFGL